MATAFSTAMFRKKQAPADRTLEKDFIQIAGELRIKVVSIDAQKAEVEISGIPSVILFQNLRAVWQVEAPAERLALVRRFVSSSMSVDREEAWKSVDQVRSNLMLRLGPADVAIGDKPEDQVAKWMLVPDFLSAFLVVDSPQTVSYIMPEHLKLWNTTFEDLYPIAFENLRRKTSATQSELIPNGKGLRAYMSGDSFDAARALMLGELISPWPEHGALFTVPTRDVLLFVPLDQAEAVGAMNVMVNAMRRILQKDPPYRITNQIFWFDGSVFERIPVMHEESKFAVAPSDRFNEVMFGLIRERLKTEATGTKK